MREINPKSISKKKQPILIVQDSPKHQQLVKVNRYLIYLALSLMTTVVVLGWLLIPSKNPLHPLNSPSLQAHAATPVLTSEINILKGQVVGLVSGSIESKLRTLEDSVRAGSINTALGTIQDLKRDVQTLQAYSDPQSVKEPPKVVIDVLLAEVSHLKNLIYLTLASVSLMFAALAGIWFKKRYRLPQLRTAYLSQQK